MPKKAHKNFLELTHTKGDQRLLFKRIKGGYTVILQVRSPDNEWVNYRRLVYESSFIVANAIWVHLTNQIPGVWERTRYR